MRRHTWISAVLLVLIIPLCLTACRDSGKNPPPQEEQGQTQTEGEPQGQDDTKGEDLSSGTEPAPGEGKDEAPPIEDEPVTLVIPAAYESISSQEEADAVCEANGYDSAVLLEDGSLSVTMRRSVYEEIMKEFTEAVERGLQEMAASEQYPQIRSVEHNDAYSEFTVVTDSEEIVPPEEYTAQELIMYGTLFHYYTGNDVEEIRVMYVNSADRRVLLEYSSGGLE